MNIDTTQKKPSRLHVVSRLRREEVEMEIKELHEQAGTMSEPTAMDRFRLRATAAKNVYSRLTVNEQAKVSAAVERAVGKGNPPDIQQKCVVRFTRDISLTYLL